jgi:CcmD family protein
MNVLTHPGSRKAGAAVRGLVVLAVVVCCASVWSAAVMAQQPPASGSQGEFVPVKDLPQQEHLPAAPLLITAYIVVWLALLAYLWTIWRRLGHVDQELRSLSRRLDEQRLPKR